MSKINIMENKKHFYLIRKKQLITLANTV